MNAYGLSDKGPVRDMNEDSFAYEMVGNCLCMAVADGVGGEACGEIASKIAGMDGVYRCYCFNQEAGSLFGACLLNGTTPDGYEVDATGAWTQNGIVMTKTAN